MTFDLFIADIFFMVIAIIAAFLVFELSHKTVADPLRSIMIAFFAARVWTMGVNFLFYLLEPPLFTPMYLRLLTLMPEAFIMLLLLYHFKKHNNGNRNS